jgi:hypothetical protein
MTWNVRTLLTASTLLMCMGILRAQDRLAPLFPGEEHLLPCVVDLPLTYRRKHEERYMKAAADLKGTELIYLQWDKRRRKAGYKRVHVVVHDSNMGTTSVFIEGTPSYLGTSTTKEVIFPQFDRRRERFYRADLFDAVLLEHPELKEVLVQRK